MQICPSESAKIEECTRAQAESKLWCALHNGRLTSSKFGEILRRRESTDPNSLVMRIMGYKQSASALTPAMRWGKDNDDRAR